MSDHTADRMRYRSDGEMGGGGGGGNVLSGSTS